MPFILFAAPPAFNLQGFAEATDAVVLYLSLWANLPNPSGNTTIHRISLQASTYLNAIHLTVSAVRGAHVITDHILALADAMPIKYTRAIQPYLLDMLKIADASRRDIDFAYASLKSVRADTDKLLADAEISFASTTIPEEQAVGQMIPSKLSEMLRVVTQFNAYVSKFADWWDWISFKGEEDHSPSNSTAATPSGEAPPAVKVDVQLDTLQDADVIELWKMLDEGFKAYMTKARFFQTYSHPSFYEVQGVESLHEVDPLIMKYIEPIQLNTSSAVPPSLSSPSAPAAAASSSTGSPTTATPTSNLTVRDQARLKLQSITTSQFFLAFPSSASDDDGVPMSPYLEITPAAVEGYTNEHDETLPPGGFGQIATYWPSLSRAARQNPFLKEPQVGEDRKEIEPGERTGEEGERQEGAEGGNAVGSAAAGPIEDRGQDRLANPATSNADSSALTTTNASAGMGANILAGASASPRAITDIGASSLTAAIPDGDDRAAVHGLLTQAKFRLPSIHGTELLSGMVYPLFEEVYQRTMGMWYGCPEASPVASGAEAEENKDPIVAPAEDEQGNKVSDGVEAPATTEDTPATAAAGQSSAWYYLLGVPLLYSVASLYYAVSALSGSTGKSPAPVDPSPLTSPELESTLVASGDSQVEASSSDLESKPIEVETLVIVPEPPKVEEEEPIIVPSPAPVPVIVPSTTLPPPPVAPVVAPAPHRSAQSPPVIAVPVPRGSTPPAAVQPISVPQPAPLPLPQPQAQPQPAFKRAPSAASLALADPVPGIMKKPPSSASLGSRHSTEFQSQNAPNVHFDKQVAPPKNRAPRPPIPASASANAPASGAGSSATSTSAVAVAVAGPSNATQVHPAPAPASTSTATPHHTGGSRIPVSKPSAPPPTPKFSISIPSTPSNQPRKRQHGHGVGNGQDPSKPPLAMAKYNMAVGSGAGGMGLTASGSGSGAGGSNGTGLAGGNMGTMNGNGARSSGVGVSPYGQGYVQQRSASAVDVSAARRAEAAAGALGGDDRVDGGVGGRGSAEGGAGAGVRASVVGARSTQSLDLPSTSSGFGLYGKESMGDLRGLADDVPVEMISTGHVVLPTTTPPAMAVVTTDDGKGSSDANHMDLANEMLSPFEEVGRDDIDNVSADGSFTKDTQNKSRKGWSIRSMIRKKSAKDVFADDAAPDMHMNTPPRRSSTSVSVGSAGSLTSSPVIVPNTPPALAKMAAQHEQEGPNPKKSALPKGFLNKRRATLNMETREVARTDSQHSMFANLKQKTMKGKKT